jgi:hypothetical protein
MSCGLNWDTQIWKSEDHKIDNLTLILDDRIYVTEIKVVKSKEALSEGKNPALEQIRERKYAEKYTGQKDRPVYEVGMVFGQKERNLVAFDDYKCKPI